MLRRGLLLDRDGVINIDHGYVFQREKFTFTLGLFPFLREMQNAGYRLVVVTNQSGVARGYYTVEDFNRLTAWMLEGFQREGIAIDAVLATFEHRDGVVEGLARESFWRKPNPGLILEAALKCRLDLARSAMIGDHEADMLAATSAGVGKRLWLTSAETPEMEGVTVVSDFAEALSVLRPN